MSGRFPKPQNNLYDRQKRNNKEGLFKREAKILGFFMFGAYSWKISRHMQLYAIQIHKLPIKHNCGEKTKKLHTIQHMVFFFTVADYIGK